MSVLFLIGSASDLDKVKPALGVFKDFGVGYEVHICSAHRTPRKAEELVKNARGNGFRVVICAAGMAAHLAGAAAANTILPIIGIPISSGALGGVDALYSTVQMPPGVPVATVAIDGAQNAVLLAIQILATSDQHLADKLIEYKQGLAAKVEKADLEFQETQQ